MPLQAHPFGTETPELKLEQPITSVPVHVMRLVGCFVGLHVSANHRTSANAKPLSCVVREDERGCKAHTANDEEGTDARKIYK